MYTIEYPHKVVLLTSSFQYPPRRVLFGRARLFMDRIELSGWHFGDKYHEFIPLDQVSHIRWDADERVGANAIFHLTDGTTFPLRLKQVRLWQQTLEERMRWSTPGRYRLAPAAAPQEIPLQDLVTYGSVMG